jgi:hypothetical protein
MTEPTTDPGAKPPTDEPWRILSEWIGSGMEAHAAMAELAEAGYVIVARDDADVMLDAAEEYICEQDARVPNMVLDVDRHSTATYVVTAMAALYRFRAALAARPDGAR